MSRTEERATERFRLNRAGVLNVWQYDEQVFDFGGGRLLLRGANGAGKSKTLELLLPFCLDGDRQRMNASGRAQTALTWLMFDGVDDKVRTGYVWVEFSRTGESGEPEFITCGVGLRAARGSGSVTSWMFCTPQRIGAELAIEDADGPVGRSALSTAVSPDGRVFEVARDYRAHVGQLLFGLDPGRYDDLLRLLYWLRQPQIGEEIDPKRIAEQLVQSLPELDPGELSKAGSTLDELADFGEKLRRTQAAQSAVASALEVYARYAQGVLRERAATLVEADEGRRRLERAARQLDHERTQLLAVLT
ncbi:MAG: TIGR02680 family protein, partial [Actinomycetes bacterium]